MNGRRAARGAAALAALALCGCLELETLIKLNEDGSATITERLRFSKRLLDLGSKEGAALDVASLLKKETAVERAKSFGKGTSLVSFEVRDAEKGSRESVAVYKIEDLNELRYVSPFLAYKDYPENCTVRARLLPLYESRFAWDGYQAGNFAVSFRQAAEPKRERQPKEGDPLPKGPTPLEVQVFRDLRPVFRDVLKGFKLKFTFEAYTPIVSVDYGYRGRLAGTKAVDLIDFSDQNLDNYGYSFLDNEEIMVDLLRWGLGSKNVAEHVKGAPNNPTLPLFHPWGSKFAPYVRGDGIYIRPSRELFNKHFEGKTLDFGKWDKGKRPANFEEVAPK